MTEQLSEKEEKILFHTLGYEYKPYWNDTRREERNWIGINHSDSPDYLCIKSLIQKGYMIQGRNTPWGEEVYLATPAAEEYVVTLWNEKKKVEYLMRSKPCQD